VSLATNAIDRIKDQITSEADGLSLADYIELLEELQDEIETRLDGAKEDKERADNEKWEAAVDAEVAQELEAKRDLDGSEGE
jgi:CO dehydrogenase/acetyl-CoA synthase beta subunit